MIITYFPSQPSDNKIETFQVCIMYHYARVGLSIFRRTTVHMEALVTRVCEI